MNQRLKSFLWLAFDLRSLILAFAVFNFILVWREAHQSWGGGVVNPWFYPWSYTNEPTTLLVAALFLRTNRWWGNIVSLVLSGYLIAYFLRLLTIIYDPWEGLRNDWYIIRRNYPYLVGSWDSQYMFAVVIFCVSAFFIVRGILRWNALRRTGDNKSLDRSGGSVFRIKPGAAKVA